MDIALLLLFRPSIALSHEVRHRWVNFSSADCQKFLQRSFFTGLVCAGAVSVSVEVPRKADVWKRLSGVEIKGRSVPVLPAVQRGSPQTSETYEDNSQ